MDVALFYNVCNRLQLQITATNTQSVFFAKYQRCKISETFKMVKKKNFFWKNLFLQVKVSVEATRS